MIAFRVLLAKMPAAKPHDASVASLLRRAGGPKLPQRNGGALTGQALLSIRPTPEKLLTLTSQQRLIQQIHDAQAQQHPRRQSRLEDERDFGDDDPASQPAASVEIAGVGLEGSKIDSLLNELLELREALGLDEACRSTVEQEYLCRLHESIVLTLSQQVIEFHSHAVENRGTFCEALLTLSVKPIPLAREISFTLLHAVTRIVSVWSAMTTTNSSPDHVATTQPLARLFSLCLDMLSKSIAIASTSAPLPHTQEFSTQSPDYKWLLSVTSCLTTFLRHSSGHSYRQDRLVKLDAPMLTFLLRTAFSMTTASGLESEIQDQILEIALCTLYAQRGSRSSNASRTPTQSDHNELPISIVDVEKWSGVELFLSIFYSTRSEGARRLILVVLFDLTLEQLKNNNKLEGDDAWTSSYDSVIRNLQQADFAALVTQSPLSFTSAHEHAIVKALHAAVENELLERHVNVFWSAFRAVLQLDECFVHSVSLANAIKVISNTTSQQPHTHESVAESIAAKALQLIASGRMEERFKGERWLAELLVYGLPTETKETSTYGEQHLLRGKESSLIRDPRKEIDDGAEFRRCAHTKLWEISKAPSVGMRLAFTHVLSLFTRRRLHACATKASMTDHIQGMKHFLKTFVAANEPSIAVLMSIVETLLVVVVSPQEIPYLDTRRLNYDVESSDSSLEALGALVGSDSLASKILRGVVSVDATLVAEIPLDFLLHTLAVFDASPHCVSHPSASSGSVLSHSGDVAVVTALLVSYAAGSHTASDTATTASSLIHLLAPYLDARDARIAVIIARAITAQLKREYGERQYFAIVRDLHTAAVDRDDESALANEVAHVRAVLHHVTDSLGTP